MRKKLASLLLLFSLFVLALPVATLAQNRDDYRGLIRRDKNGVRVGDSRITLFDGPGILNYQVKHRWMEARAVQLRSSGSAPAPAPLLVGSSKARRAL